MKYLLGKKIGQTQYITDTGKVEQVTVIEAGPCPVTQVKKQTVPTFQIGFGSKKKLNKPTAGHLKGKNVRHLREFKYDDTNKELYTNDATVDLNIFDTKGNLSITGISKGKGFAGTVKRHHFVIGPKTHGSKNQRKPGSIGCRYPQHVIKGRKMPGHMGVDRVTIKNLKIINIEVDKNLLVVRGAVPGNKNSLLILSQN